MISFLDFLLEETEHRKRQKTNVNDAAFVRKNYPQYNRFAVSQTVKDIRKNFIKHIKASGIVDDNDFENSRLSDLQKIIDDKHIDIHAWLGKRKAEWKNHEKDVVNSLNFLFQQNFFENIRNGKADATGKDIKQADVHVTADNADFYIECKLDFYSSEYFKYGIKIVNDTIIYNHKKYTDGLDKVIDKEQISKIDRLFNEQINISQFLNDIMKSKELKDAWKKFLQNAHDVEDFMKNSVEFKDFCKDTFKNVWPDDFKVFIKTFDAYCNFYIDKYNKLVDFVFTMFDSSKLDKSSFKILSHDKESDNNAFTKIALIYDEIEKRQLKVYDKNKLDKTVKLILNIENKFNKLLYYSGRTEDQIDKILSLKDNEKTKYFFKMFISTSGRHSKSNLTNMLSEDSFGNMEICNVRNFKTQKLAELITNFYQKKDNCQYIQIDNILFQFDKDLNSLQIERLPLFKDVLQQFNIKLSVADDMSSIKLKITAVKPKQQELQKFNLVSLKQKDANFIKIH